MSPFQTFAPELRKLGFRKEWSHRIGGVRVDGWEKPNIQEPELETWRTLKLQIWADGAHRVSHAIGSHETTRPTDFRTIEEMRGAVEWETARRDAAEFQISRSSK
jgi:hypothetical protein